ncbi:hypothetical protein HYT18_04780 [Candidatus Microgenomates bacterium]|nr:hypothetical protein [Candidatus Microgenomates bacterium]
MTLVVETGRTYDPTGIKVEFDDTVLRNGVPYKVSVDQPRASQLLLNHGILPEKVAQAKLLIRERPLEQTLVPREGYFYGEDLTMALYTDVIFNRMQRKPGNRPNHVFLHEAKHLINLVTRPNYEKGTGRLFSRVQTATFYAGMISVLIALSLSLPDVFWARNDQKIQLMTYQLATFGAIFYPTFVSFYHLNPMELSAQRFAYRLNKQPEWQSIVTISPKNK